MGIGADVTIVDKSWRCCATWTKSTAAAGQTLYATRTPSSACPMPADLVIGAVLIPGAAAPKLVTRRCWRR